MPPNRDTLLLETVRTHRARLLSALLYGRLPERRPAQDNLRRLLASVILGLVGCVGCIGVALILHLT